LNDRIWTNRRIFGDSYFAWEQIVKLALEQEVRAVILAGDVLDKQINGSGPIHALLAGLYQLQEGGIEVWAARGFPIEK